MLPLLPLLRPGRGAPRPFSRRLRPVLDHFGTVAVVVRCDAVFGRYGTRGRAEETAPHVSRYRLGHFKRLALPPTRRVP